MNIRRERSVKTHLFVFSLCIFPGKHQIQEHCIEVSWLETGSYTIHTQKLTGVNPDLAQDFLCSRYCFMITKNSGRIAVPYGKNSKSNPHSLNYCILLCLPDQINTICTSSSFCIMKTSSLSFFLSNCSCPAFF